MSEPPESPSREVIFRIKGGDSDALSCFLALHREKLKGWLSFGLGMPRGRGADASDVVQDAFLEVATSIRDFRGHTEEQLLAWVCRILRNRSVDLSRKRVLLAGRQYSGDSTSSGAGLLEQIPDDASSPSQHVMHDESIARHNVREDKRKMLRDRQIRDAADKLSSEQLAVVLLHEVDAISLREIATRLESDPTEVARRFLEGMRSLRAAPQWCASEIEPGGGERQALFDALELLSERQRDAVLLQHLEGFSMEETAATLGTSPAAVGSAVYRGIIALQSMLRASDYSGEKRS